MIIKKIISYSVGIVCSAFEKLKNLKHSKKSSRPSRVNLPPTNPDWHNELNAKMEVDDPEYFIVALRPNTIDPQHNWLFQVHDALELVCQSLVECNEIPMELTDLKSGETIGEVVILDSDNTNENADLDALFKLAGRED